MIGDGPRNINGKTGFWSGFNMRQYDRETQTWGPMPLRELGPMEADIHRAYLAGATIGCPRCGGVDAHSPTC